MAMGNLEWGLVLTLAFQRRSLYTRLTSPSRFPALNSSEELVDQRQTPWTFFLEEAQCRLSTMEEEQKDLGERMLGSDYRDCLQSATDKFNRTEGVYSREAEMVWKSALWMAVGAWLSILYLWIGKKVQGTPWTTDEAKTAQEA
jgi:hypothetical protein